jgi:UDP-N-acetylmuramoylalanine--D-glutamate ligase
MKKTILIHGLGISGNGALRFFLNKKDTVYVSDQNEEKIKAAEEQGAMRYDTKAHTAIAFDCLIQSPGIPMDHPITQQCLQRKIPLFTDVAYFMAYVRAHTQNCIFIGITGTNGKSTTSTLIHHMLVKNGFTAHLGGNCGVSVFDLPIENHGVYVFELSSYQLALSPSLALDYAVWTNFSPDHLTWHKTLHQYQKAKEKIFEGSHHYIIGIDDYISKDVALSLESKEQSRVHVASFKDHHPYAFFSSLKGQHNHQNAAIAYTLGRLFHIPKERVYESFESFPGLIHRQYPVYQSHTRHIINDSKATNAEAAMRALQSFSPFPVYWIMGGMYKGDSFACLKPYMQNVQKIYIIGKDIDPLLHALKEADIKTPYRIAHTLDQATQWAFKDMDKNQHKDLHILLLSPACASFDQFDNFEKRGKAFHALVEKHLCESIPPTSGDMSSVDRPFTQKPSPL